LSQFQILCFKVKDSPIETKPKLRVDLSCSTPRRLLRVSEDL
jgi:hypothetical protein